MAARPRLEAMDRASAAASSAAGSIAGRVPTTQRPRQLGQGPGQPRRGLQPTLERDRRGEVFDGPVHLAQQRARGSPGGGRRGRTSNRRRRCRSRRPRRARRGAVPRGCRRRPGRPPAPRRRCPTWRRGRSGSSRSRRRVAPAASRALRHAPRSPRAGATIRPTPLGSNAVPWTAPWPPASSPRRPWTKRIE